MRLVIQRVREASVTVDKTKISQIANGLLIFLGIGKKDTDADVHYLVDKTLNLRIFEDADGKMNLSLLDVKGEILVVSQFTLYGDTRKGRRPSFFDSMEPKLAELVYAHFISELKKSGLSVKEGQFGAMMHVSLINDGPVTFLVDSEKRL